ncbi:MAG TPA: DUF1592 domain-containing protein [Pirellulaceae bacterium]|nr:DUF1592 domain-containing protein [Pirellulaceae bacterium]
MKRELLVVLSLVTSILATACVGRALAQPIANAPITPDADAKDANSIAAKNVAGLTKFVESHCVACHDSTQRKAGLALDGLLAQPVEKNSPQWESVVRKLTTRQMPPPNATRPAEAEYQAVVGSLTSRLDAAAARSPHPGRTPALRRLSRTEYGHAIRDLLAVQVDVGQWLPADESSQGFDNITVTDLSPTLLNRYVSAAQKISRLAVGAPGPKGESTTFRVRADVTQDHQRVAGLPLGTRGGLLVPHQFPRDGEYEIQITLMRDRNDELEGMNGAHELQILVDRERVASFTIRRAPRGESNRLVDAQLVARTQVKSGPHDVGATFVAKPFSLLETERQPLNVHYNYYRHPRLGPAVYQLTITGPIGASAPGDSPSRRRIFIARPTGADDELEAAKRIISNLARRAYRRPVDDEDLVKPLAFFREGRAAGDFDAGIERALASILVSPQFLFRIERDRPDAPAEQPHRISALELASRLSFFLWSSIPDDELLDAAIDGTLNQPDVLERQVRRMLADERSQSLVTNFADQWLYLRNLEAVTPDARLFPDFDHNLRDSLRRETELLFEEMLREDHSVLKLLDSRHTYVNERLAKHYGLPQIQGSHFRRVALDDAQQRGGILRHGSVLAVTSYATRTSPVIRGKWIMENLLGSPPPPPPPNVPALDDNTVSAALPVRQRLAAHRANAACAVCHDTIDPIGFGLENFDAIGRWRLSEQEQPVDASGGMPDGVSFVGVDGLEKALLRRPELFVRTMVEKLLTFGLGRGVEHYDAPAVRQIVRDAKDADYRFSSLILGIVKSVPFQMRSPEHVHQ